MFLAAESPCIGLADHPGPAPRQGVDGGDRVGVGGAVVDDDHLERGHGLVEDTADRVVEVAAVVEARHDDADERLVEVGEVALSDPGVEGGPLHEFTDRVGFLLCRDVSQAHLVTPVGDEPELLAQPGRDRLNDGRGLRFGHRHEGGVSGAAYPAPVVDVGLRFFGFDRLVPFEALNRGGREPGLAARVAHGGKRLRTASNGSP